MKVLEICVMPGKRRIKLTIEMPDPDRFLTSQVPHVPRRLLRMMPRLGKHTCHNDRGLSFKQECRETEIPHLFEHLIIELQLQAQQQETDLLTGETEWDWQVDPRGYYHVYVDYQNELLAVGAIRLAERVLKSLDHRDVSVNIEEEMVRLRELLRLGRELEGPRLPVEEEVETQPARSWASVKFAAEMA